MSYKTVGHFIEVTLRSVLLVEETQEYPEKITSLSKVKNNDILYEAHLTMSGIQTKNLVGDRHYLYW